MVLVFFRGRGEWFIRDDNNIKLAIPRTTKEPYKDHMEYGWENDYCPDYPEWLGCNEDNEENFSEWVQLHESSKNQKHTYDYPSKDNKYDYHLEGIFVRNPNIRGDIYDTNDLFCRGANFIKCPEIQGIFKLNNKDEKAFQLTQNWDEIKKKIKTLDPCTHPDSAFLEKVSDGNLKEHDIDKYFFEIQDKQYFNLWCNESTSIDYSDYTLELLPSTITNLSNTNKSISANNENHQPLPQEHKTKPWRRVDRLAEFIDWIEENANAKEIPFNRKAIVCTKEQLFKAIVVWEESFYEGLDKLFSSVAGWSCCGKIKGKNFWFTQERKDICILDDESIKGKGKDCAAKLEFEVFSKKIGIHQDIDS